MPILGISDVRWNSVCQVRVSQHACAKILSESEGAPNMLGMIAEGKVPEGVTGKTRARGEEIGKIQRTSGRETGKVQRRMKDVACNCKGIRRGGKGLRATAGPAEGRSKMNRGKLDEVKKRGSKNGSTNRR